MTSTEEFRQLLNSDQLSFRFDGGVSIPSTSVSIEDKEKIAIALAKNFVIYSCKAELDQLKDGLSHLGVLNIFQDHPKLMKPLLLSSGKRSLNSSQVLDLFKTVWSPEGSNQREREESVIFGWTHYVHSCGGKNRMMYMCMRDFITSQYRYNNPTYKVLAIC